MKQEVSKILSLLQEVSKFQEDIKALSETLDDAMSCCICNGKENTLHFEVIINLINVKNFELQKMLVLLGDELVKLG